MNVTDIPAVRGARHRRKRVGRGVGSGHGKTATRGTKGQRARTGSRKRPGFEGGHTPLIRRIPKRGFKQKATGRPEPFEIVNIGSLNDVSTTGKITPEVLLEVGLVRRDGIRIKLLGDGELKKRVTIVVHSASASAKQKIEQAGGTVELLSSSPKAS